MSGNLRIVTETGYEENPDVRDGKALDESAGTGTPSGLACPPPRSTTTWSAGAIRSVRCTGEPVIRAAHFKGVAKATPAYDQPTCGFEEWGQPEAATVVGRDHHATPGPVVSAIKTPL